tara:strand:- start:153 stop:1679 length:1527 start_codon:yes stop_codon:yes gene_type:complete
MGKGEWKGWNDWNAYEKAGIVENDVDFSDEDIIIDHAIGKTKNKIGKCWPMDAALAYTLVKAGPNAELTWDDMINDYTKSAAIMMSGIVAIDSLPDLSVKSCGHDEIFGCNHLLAEPTHTYSADDVVHISPRTGWKSKTMGLWLKEKDAPDNLVEKYSKIRLDGMHTINGGHLLSDEYFTELMDFIVKCYKEEGHTISTVSNLDWVKQRQKTLGKCKWADDDEKNCLHHDKPSKRYWALYKNGDGFEKIWSKGRCYQGWNNNQFTDFDDIKHDNIVKWDEVRRGMNKKVSNSEVLKHVKASLSRMMKRKDNIVLKEGVGRTATHKWNDWAWVSEMTAYVKLTNSKNRKEGDTENGWTYTKVRSRKSHGHEIADFVWKPIESIYDYYVDYSTSDSYYYSSTNPLKCLMFASKTDAEKFAQSIGKAHLDAGGYFDKRIHKGLEKIPNMTVSIKKKHRDVTMKGNIDPDDYLNPEEVINMWRNASNTVLSEHRDKFELVPDYGIKTEKVEA